jgi:hypothetical protein
MAEKGTMMPKRTNHFQELFALVQHATGETGDKLTRSAMVKTVGSEDEREIDILVETKTGLYRIKMAVEIKDEGRPLDVETFDTYVGKYFGKQPVAVDKLVLVSRSGFTASVRRKASNTGVELLTLQQARDRDWASFRQHLLFSSDTVGLKLQFSPMVRDIGFVPAICPSLAEAAISQGHVHSPDGRDLGTPMQVAHQAMTADSPDRKSWAKEATERVRQKLDKQARRGLQQHEILNGTFSVGLKGHVLILDGKSHRFERMIVRFLTADACVQAKCTHYELAIHDGKAQIVHHFEADIGEDTVEWVVPDGRNATKISFKIRSKK